MLRDQGRPSVGAARLFQSSAAPRLMSAFIVQTWFRRESVVSTGALDLPSLRP